MSGTRSQPGIGAAPPWSTCANPPWPKSNAIGNRPTASTLWSSKRALGWAREQIAVIDDDLGLSGASTSHRNGFARMTAEVAMGRVGIVLGLEVSRLARNN